MFFIFLAVKLNFLNNSALILTIDTFWFIGIHIFVEKKTSVPVLASLTKPILIFVFQVLTFKFVVTYATLMSGGVAAVTNHNNVFDLTGSIKTNIANDVIINIVICHVYCCLSAEILKLFKLWVLHLFFHFY